MQTELIARRGRLVLWGLVFYVLGQGVLSRYGFPDGLYFEINTLLAGDYALQERVLAQYPVKEGAHRLLGITLLVLGMFQFDAGLRRRRPLLHRWSGRVFLALAVVIGLTGLALGFAVPFAGDAERLFVAIVGAAFFGYGIRAYALARRRQFASHREWMVRLLGLSFFIAVQRVYYLLAYPVAPVDQPTLFLLTGWGAVATVTVAAEWWIRRTRPLPSPSAIPESSPA